MRDLGGTGLAILASSSSTHTHTRPPAISPPQWHGSSKGLEKGSQGFAQDQLFAQGTQRLEAPRGGVLSMAAP